jgi:hypothetical protein
MTYALFRHRKLPDFYCAIPQGMDVPAFVQDEQWEPSGETRPDEPRPLGFDAQTARYSVELQGYYTFREQSFVERQLQARRSGDRPV